MRSDDGMSAETQTTGVPNGHHADDVQEKNINDPSDSTDDPSTKDATTTPAPGFPPPPPNGGLQAWLHVVGGFMLFFNSWGLLNTFGVFQTYYESGALFDRSSSDISWIGSVQSALVALGGVFSGPIYDRGYFRTLIIAGSLAIVLGIELLSLATRYYQVLLAQGILTGLGAGCLFVPCVSILPTYFNTRLGLAVGLASSGASIGGVIYPIVFNRLISQIGYPWAVRVLGFIALGTLLIPIALMRMRYKSPKPRALIDLSAFTDFQYMAFALGALIGFVGLSVLLFYVSFYPENTHVTDTRTSFYIVAIFNGASAFGRILPNALSDKIGIFNILAPCTIITAVLMFSFIGARTEASIIALTVLSGFFSGVFIAMPPVCFATITKDKSKIGTRIGMGFGMISLGLLAGGPAGGGVLGTVEPLRWAALWGFAGAVTFVSSLIFFTVRVHRSGFKIFIKT
ncbi:MFS general substrate transporter [Ustulina deusta]|nr:MFS general substrate transporter [Ustulina deusta]